MKDVKVAIGILGAGYIAEVAHLPSYAKVKQANVIAICDENETKARELASRYRVPNTYRNLGEMLLKEKLDLVDVCLPPHLHVDAVKEILNCGCPVLVEKPLTIASSDADDLIKLAESKKVQLFVIHNYSAVPAFLRARKMVKDGLIGDVVGININHFVAPVKRYLDPDHWNHQLPGEYFSEMLPHLAMILVDYLGPVKKVQAVCTKLSSIPLKYDEMRIVAATENGLGTINISLNCPAFTLTSDIIGTKGTLNINGDYQSVVLRTITPSESGALTRGITGVKDIISRTSALTGTSFGVLMGQYSPYTQGHRHLIKECILDLIGESTYPISNEAAKESVRLIEMVFAEVHRSELK